MPKVDKKFFIIGSVVLAIVIAVGAYFYMSGSDESGLDFGAVEDPTAKIAGVGSDIGDASETNPYENTNPFDYKSPFE